MGLVPARAGNLALNGQLDGCYDLLISVLLPATSSLGAHRSVNI